MNRFLLSKVPISYDTLVIESTNKCNAKCAICYQASGPSGSDLLGLGNLPTDLIIKALKEATHIHTLGPRIHLSGGEAFLNIKQCKNIFQAAKDAGYLEISATTNAFWAKNSQRAYNVAQAVRKSGLTRIEISWDSWHSKFVSIESICNCIKACYEAGIEIVLRTLSTKNESAADALCNVRDDVIDLVDELVCCPVIPSGRAANEIDIEDVLFTDTLGSACHYMLNLTVNCFGDVYPCCSGLDQNGNLSFGNIHKESLIDIVKHMNKSLLLRVLVFQGPGSFVPILEDVGVEVGRNFNTICHLCWSIFKSKDNYETILNYFNNLEKLRIIDSLSLTTLCNEQRML